MKKMERKDWIWMPRAGHFIMGNYCRFHLNTYVGGYIVSTVGEYFPDSALREIIAEVKGIKLIGKGDSREADFLRKNGYEELGAGRKYETMVFKAEKRKEDLCCPYMPIDFHEEDFAGYNTPEDAYQGHLEMCEKWAVEKTEVTK